MDKLISKLVGFGVAGLVLLFLVYTSGVAGAAAISVALSTLGGPLGMLGGIFVFALLVMIADAIATYGIEALARGVVEGLCNKGYSKEKLIKEVEKFPLISQGLKDIIIKYIKLIEAC